MRTKTLLIAAAALAAAVTSSQAQTVYSQNIVGYVNQTLPVGQFVLMTAPLSSTTNAIDVQMPCLLNGDEVLTWTPGNFTYTTWSYIGAGASQPGGTGYGNWTTDFVNYCDSPKAVPGGAFFYANGQSIPETNTFAGGVVLSNSVSLAVGQFDLTASTVPIADYLDDPTNMTAPFENGDEVLTWSAGSFTYTTWSYIGPGYNQPGGTGYGNWTTDFVNYCTAPFVGVGQGFFYANGQSSTESWTQNDSYINP
jgi:hypothetical protein